MKKKKITEERLSILKENLFDSMWKMISKGAGKKLISNSPNVCPFLLIATAPRLIIEFGPGIGPSASISITI